MRKRRTRERFSIIGRVIRVYYSHFRGAVVAFLIFVALAVVCAVLGPRILGLATTRIFRDVMAIANGTGHGVDFGYVARIGIILLCLYTVQYFCQYMQGRIMTRVTNRTTYYIRQDISKKLNALPLSYFEQHTYGETLTLITNDADVVAYTANQVTTQLCNGIGSVVAIGAMMLSMNVELALLALVMIPVAWIVSRLVAHCSGKHFDAHQENLAHLTSHSEVHYAAREAICRANDTESSQFEFSAANAGVYASGWKGHLLSGLFLPAMTVVTNLTYVGICVLGGTLVIRNTVTIGAVQAFLQYVRNISVSVTQMAAIQPSTEHVLSALNRIFSFLDMQEEQKHEGKGEKEPWVPTEDSDLVLKDVQFSYDGVRQVLRGVSLDVLKGSRVVLTGSRGSGKSTLLTLIAGLNVPQSGYIRLGDTDLGACGQEEWAREFGYAPQDAWLEHETVADNLRFGRSALTDAQIIDAAKTAQAHDFISRLPMGYETMVQERGSNFSQGQKQMLQIARALAGQPAVLLLDDVLDVLDVQTCESILDALQKTGITQLIVSKCLQTVCTADMVIFLTEGCVVQTGTPQELQAQGGPFAAFFGLEEDQSSASA